MLKLLLIDNNINHMQLVDIDIAFNFCILRSFNASELLQFCYVVIFLGICCKQHFCFLFQKGGSCQLENIGQAAMVEK
jgi:hypothetical protein